MSEKGLIRIKLIKYPVNIIDSALFPLKLIIPQPAIKNISGLSPFVAALNRITYRPGVLKKVGRVLKPGGLLLIINLSPLISLLWHKCTSWDKDQHERGWKKKFMDSERGNWLNCFKKCGVSVNKTEKFTWKINQLYIGLPE